MVKLSELRKKYAEEIKKKKEEGGILDGTTEEIESLIIDIRYTAGGLSNLFTINDAYVCQVDENVKKIEEIIRKGKVAKIKGRRIIGSKRLEKIESVEEVDDPDVKEENIWKGEIENVPPSVRFIREDGEIYWFDGSLNLERIMNEVSPGEIKPVIVIPAIIYSRMSSSGRSFKRIRGFYYTIIEEEIPEQVEV